MSTIRWIAPQESQSQSDTVFISSRMEETSNARRVVFDGVLDAGMLPLSFETMPPLKDELSREDRKLQEREVLDRIISFSDFFVGLYADTMGEREAYLCMMRPIEYEFLRFMMQAEMRSRIPATPELEIRRRLRRLFPSPSDDRVRATGGYGTDLRVEIIRMQKEVEHLELLKRAYEQEIVQKKEYKALFRKAMSTMPFARVFEKRVKLFQRVRKTNGVMASELAYVLQHKSVTDFGKYAKGCDSPNGASDQSAFPSYFSTAQILYSSVYDWCSDKRRKVSGAESSDARKASGSGRRTCFLVRGTQDTHGYLQLVCKQIYEFGFNLVSTAIGRINAQYGHGRGIAVEVEPFFEAAIGRAQIDDMVNAIAAELERHEVSRALPRRNSTQARCRELLPQHRPNDAIESDIIYAQGDRIQSTKRTISGMYDIDIECADVPGMMYKAVDLIARRGGSVVGARSKRGMRFVCGPQDEPIGLPGRATISLVVRLLDQDTQLPMKEADSEAECRSLCAELRFLHGVYVVRCLRIKRRLRLQLKTSRKQG